ncbi:hypothetical protein OF122_09165 [Pelagibacterium flavum]|uniref:DUF3311 domain-containing protein n=1 Tax=Pelagibacterium flavum TaxID=2984530 RepID=A0ABY6ITH0_9HYPH|nr:hypothetical protein [Pelagibacterium sp. YIM 151497]UYQ73909.1 hypothetical protein OF122_09165 [Pelagibacterium sp. YIM 151497]|tara:strand:- start:2777 stop:3010 length:234 start_codon:yes stop_codon:yes gene_type:complete
MTRRKIIGASLFFTLFGAMASLPPLILLFRFEAIIFGLPVATLFLFGLWVFLVIGAAWFGYALPRDEPHQPAGEEPR